MSIKYRALSTIIVIFVAAAAIVYVGSTRLVENQFGRIETDDAKDNMSRGIDGLHNKIDQMDGLIGSWSNWDDAYAFVENHNQAFIDSNLAPASVSGLDINYILFYSPTHQLVQATGVQGARPIGVSAAMLAQFKEHPQLMTDHETDKRQGLLRVDDRPLYFMARPILTSDAKGPVRGTIIFAKYLTAGDIQQIADIIHLPVHFYLTGQAMPADAVQAESQITSTVPAVKRLDGNAIASYQAVDDVFGNRLLIGRLVTPPTTFVQAQRSLHYFLSLIIIVTLLSTALVIFIANQVFARDKVIQLKDEFFSIASHELRTPLAAIKGNALMLDTYYGDKNDETFREMTGDIAESSMRLIRLVNNFLDAARFEKGTVPLVLAPVSLQNVCGEVAQEVTRLVSEKGLYVRSEIEASIPLVLADRDRVMQIVYNFIGNATKFTDKGGITITATRTADFVKVFITDTGRGIPPEGQKILFKKFQQVSAADSKNGSGLGLYISKLLVELQGGRVALEHSAEGVGTTISFSLPVASPSDISKNKK